MVLPSAGGATASKLEIFSDCFMSDAPPDVTWVQTRKPGSALQHLPTELLHHLYVKENIHQLQTVFVF